MKTSNRSTPPASRRAFTLIELLTVIAIIGILAAIIIPTVGKVRATAKKAHCVSNLRQWGTAVRLFANDYKGLVATYNNLGGEGNLQIYSPYFGSKNMMDPSGVSRPAQEVMSRCPSAITDPSDGDFRKRCYAFVRAGGAGPVNGVNAAGMRRVKGAVFGMDGEAANSDISCYNIGDCVTPSQFAVLMETHSPGDNYYTIDNASASFTEHVRPVQVNANQRLVRHSGAANFLFLDGHVASFSAAQTNYNSPANRQTMDRWFTFR